MLNLKTKREIDARLAHIIEEHPTFVVYLLNDKEYLEEKLDTEYKLWEAVADVQYKIVCNDAKLNSINNVISFLHRVAESEKSAEFDAKLTKLEATFEDYEYVEEDLYDEAQKAIRDYDRFYESTDALEWLGTSNYKD